MITYPGTVRDVDTTDFTRAGGSELSSESLFTFTPPSGGTNDRPYAPKPGDYTITMTSEPLSSLMVMVGDK